ncbi:MAG: alpha/beta fold hydrolase [Acidimicrobiales bacterium]
MTSTVIDNDGVGLAVSVVGDGPDLLFVHGLGSAQVLWQPLISSLSNRFCCWSLDLRGHGASDRAPGRYRPEDYTSDVVTVLDHIARPTIGIGHSLGGVSLAGAAAGGHQGLRALYILDSALVRGAGERSTSHAVFERQLAMVRRFQSERRPVDDYEAVLAEAPNPVGGTNRETMVPGQLRGRAESLSQMDPECMEVVVAGQRSDERTAAALSLPIRVLAADPDRGASFRPEHRDRLRQSSPQAEIETVHGVGHQLLMMQRFDEQVRSDLEAWLERT